MARFKKLRLLQISLLILAVVLILFTYFQSTNKVNEKIISEKTQQKIEQNLLSENSNEDKFYDISYSNIDLNGNRFIINSKEATTSKEQLELVKMKLVEAKFYFKDGAVLNINSDKGVYNNQTLDIEFNDNIKAVYEESTLFAQKAYFSNSKNYLNITESVIIKDPRGEVFADKIFFDLHKKTLDIESFKDNKINANIEIQ